MKRLLAFLFIAYTSTATAGVTGKIAGTITDANSKEPIIGVSVRIVGTNIGSATDFTGTYVVLNIPPGAYSVRISAVGYETMVFENIRVTADLTTPLSVTLKGSSVEMEEVVVTAQAPAIQKDLTSSMSVVSQQQIDALPISNFTELLSLQAGVVGSGTEFHVRGGRSNEVAYMIDGTVVQDPLFGGLAAKISNDAIQEMRLLSGTFNAEYGNALSGVVNIVTREGSDQYSGKIEARTSEFGVEEYTRLHENRVNGSLSGPVVPGLLRFFAAAEQSNQGSYLPFGYEYSKMFFAKFTITPITPLRITLSNRGSSGSRKNYLHYFKYIPSLSGYSFNDNYQGILSITHTIAEDFFYDLKFSYFNQGYYSGMPIDTSLYIPGGQFEYLTFYENGRIYTEDFYGRANPSSYSDDRTATADFKLDAVWQLHKMHEVKFGTQFKKQWMRFFSINDIKDPTRQFKDSFTTDKPYEVAAYIQDKIELPYVIINLGLRFDYFNAREKARLDPDSAKLTMVDARTQISPRIGIAHPISDRTKLHFAYGHFFQNPDYSVLYTNLGYRPSIRSTRYGNAALDAQRTVAYEVGITHQLSDLLMLSVTAYYKDVTGLVGRRNFPAYVDNRKFEFDQVINEDFANIKGMEVNVNMRQGRYFSGGLTYTYSVAKGNASSEFQVTRSYKPTLLCYLDFDKTHVFNATVTAQLPRGESPLILGYPILEDMDVTAVFRGSSGYPYTPAGRDIGYAVQNSLRMPATYSLDLEFGKEFVLYTSFRMRVFAEIMNVTNRKNAIYVYSDTGDPDMTYAGKHSLDYIHDPSNYGPPRIIRLGAGFKF